MREGRGVECRLYEEYFTYRDTLAKNVMQPLAEYPCKDKDALLEYVATAKMEEVIDPVCCSQQQHQMQGLYHVQYEGEGGCCGRE